MKNNKKGKIKITSNGAYVFTYEWINGQWLNETAYDGRTKIYKKWAPKIEAIFGAKIINKNELI